MGAAEVAPLTSRLAEHARIMENIAAGRTPSIPVGPVGARFLADDLREAIDELQRHDR